MTTPRLAIVGAGISGLAAAHRAAAVAEETGRPLEITVLEAAAQVGGKARTVRLEGHGGALVEAGPNGWLDREPALRELVTLAGLGDRIVRADADAARRFVWWDGRLREIGPHPLTLLRGGLFSLPGLLRLATEPWRRRRAPDPDESLHALAVRRLGSEAALRAVGPMALGVYAGDSRRLSATAAFPALARFEGEHGSLVAGLRATTRDRRARGEEAPRLTSLLGGMQTLPEALASTDRFEVRRASPVAALRASDGRFVLEPGGDAPSAPAPTADAVVVATEAPAAARLLGGLAPAAAEALASIPCPGIAVVGLLFRRTDLPDLPRGFGVLVARDQGLRHLGCLWESNVFPGRSDDEHLLLRFLLGGQVDPTAADLDGDELLALVLDELRATTRVEGAPVLHHVQRWRHAIPQVEPGHERRAETAQRSLDAVPGLFLAGNALEGVAFADAAACGWRRGGEAARRLLGLEPS